MIAAGSTITKDVKKGDLAISRTTQKSVKGFFYSAAIRASPSA
jgi:bifunctional N-acetylglucosamine-1-phosphate-uridyltransferase/glucosamine-1-phosphate-acetyltransferase GlmU-like protein